MVCSGPEQIKGEIDMGMTRIVMGAVVGAGLLIVAVTAAEALPVAAAGAVVGASTPDAHVLKTGVATGVAKHKAKRTVRKHVP
jgi:hypothetical protein